MTNDLDMFEELQRGQTIFMQQLTRHRGTVMVVIPKENWRDFITALMESKSLNDFKIDVDNWVNQELIQLHKVNYVQGN